MGAQYCVYNGPMQTTSSPAKVTSGTSRKTMLQLKPGATVGFEVVDWWISFDGSSAATPGVVELVEVDVAATVTAYTANDLSKYNQHALLNGDPTTALISVGTSASGYTATAEGTITATRNLAPPVQIAPTNQQIIQLPLGRSPFVQPGKFMRVIVNFAVAVNLLCGVTIEF